MIQLSKRLRMIAEKIEHGSRLADIGSDHALLPAFLAQKGIVAAAVAGELNPGPYEAALKQIKDAGLGSVVTVRRGNGLEVVKPGEVDTVTIAGMGGNLIVEILTDGRNAGKLKGVRRLVLQPNVGEEAVRRFLSLNSWSLLGEDILGEDGKIYEILLAEKVEQAPQPAELYAEQVLEGFGRITEEDWYRFGPYLLREASPVFVEKWGREINKLTRIAESLAQSELEEARQKRESVLEDITRLKELVACLQRGKPSFN
jgi:tRNA (adenine22-N1)-methyltransferase